MMTHAITLSLTTPTAKAVGFFGLVELATNITLPRATLSTLRLRLPSLHYCDFLMMQCDEVLPLTVAQVYLFIKEYLSTVSSTKYKMIVEKTYSCPGSTKIFYTHITSWRSYVRNAYMHN